MKKLTKRLWFGSDIQKDDKGEIIASPPPVATKDGSDEWHLNGLTRGELYLNDNIYDPALFFLGSDGLVRRFNGGNSTGGGGSLITDIDITEGKGIQIKKSLYGKQLVYEVSHDDTSKGESTANEGTYVVTNVVIDEFGHVTGFESKDLSITLDKKYLRKDKPDATNYLLGANGGLTIGNYIGGFLGSGGIINKEGYGEMGGLRLREFLEVPELRFNRIDVVSGELWNAIAFGLIESVDELSQIVTLKLEEGELSGMHLSDFCRGIFHNITGNSQKEGKDASGFDTIVGFSTSYFTPVEIIDNATFKYELKPGSTVHPCKAMKFAVYGNPTEKNRQSSAYHTRTYTRYLRGVNTWKIEGVNISVQLGDLSNLVIDGESLAEGSVYLNNVYFGGSLRFTPAQLDQIKGKDAYSVSLSTYSIVYNVADGLQGEADVKTVDDKVVTKTDTVITAEFTCYTRIQANKGAKQLLYSNVVGEGKYLVTSEGTGCTYTITDGVVVVQEVTADNAEIKMEVNCEGISVYDLVFTIVRVADGRDGKDYEYIYTRTATEAKPAIPATVQKDDFVPEGWTDDSAGPTLALPFEWISKRIKRDNIWGNFKTPSLWSRFGEDGKGYEYICLRTATNVRPATPETSDEDGFVPPGGWTNDPAGPTRELPFEWISKRSKINSVWGAFSIPSLWSNFSEDGKYSESIYKRTTTYSTPATPATSQEDNYVPTLEGWTDDAIGVSSGFVYEWRSERSKSKGVWSSFSTPALFAKYSFDGEPGIPGNDGRTSIMVYRRSESQPDTPQGSNMSPPNWSADPPAGSSPLWMSKAVFYESGVIYSSWSMPIKITGDTGSPGIGTPGPAITNRNIYDGSKVYTGSATRVDVVRYYFQGSYKYYMANTDAGVFSGVVPTDTRKWHPAGDQFEAIATGLAIIGEASIAGWRFKELVIESQSNNVVLNGNADSRPKIALGEPYYNMENAPARLYDDGSVYFRKGEIGGFTLGAKKLQSDSNSEYMNNYTFTIDSNEGSIGVTGSPTATYFLSPHKLYTDSAGDSSAAGLYMRKEIVRSKASGINDMDAIKIRQFGRFSDNDSFLNLECERAGQYDKVNLIKGRFNPNDAGAGRYIGLSFENFSTDLAWYFRTCFRSSHMPTIGQVGSSGEKHNVMWDKATGLLYID